MAPSLLIPRRRIVNPKTLRIVIGCIGQLAHTPPPHFISATRMLGDGANLILIDEQVWLALACQPYHPIVEVLDPAGDSLAVMQLYRHSDLFFAKETQVEGLLTGFTWRRSFLAPTRCA